MADDGASGAGSSTARDGADGPESATIEINIKTLESQVHKLRVDKNETVLNLKEKIVDVTRIPVEQQRLIFRGRVLKDDHLLSEYHLEDGYTLHLVARRTAEGQHSSETPEANPNANVNNAGNGAILGDYMSRETIDVMVSEGVINDIPATVRDILGNFLGMPGGVANATFSVPLNQPPPDGANNGRAQPGQAPPGFSILNHQIHVSQLPPSGAIPRNMVIPDSMTTLLEYINRMDQVLQNNGVPPSTDSNAQEPPTPATDDAYLNQSFPSPEVLASVVERAQQLLGGSASSALSHLAQRIQTDAATADPSVRSQIQNESAQLGVAMQHLGSMLFELGRTMMTLRMGPSPINAFVNAGPAVYITPTGPSPIMVQPSFQSAPHFGVSSIPPVFGVSGPFGIVDPSRANGVNIHGGASATSGPSVGSTTASATTANGESQNAERTQGGNPSATRGLPPHTVVAAIPAFPGRSSVGVILPVQMRSQVAVPNQSTGPQGSQTAVGNGSQPNPAYVIPQASSGSAISSMIAQISAQVANALAANPQALASLTSSVLNPAAQGPHPPTTNNGAGTVSSVTSGNTQVQNELPGSHHGQTSLNVQSHATGAGTVPSNTSDPSLTPQDVSTVSVSDVDSSQQHSGELAAASLGGQMTGTHTGDVPLDMPAENSELKSKPSDGETGESAKPTASGGSGPLGLGGGLQPKRRSRVTKLSGTSSDSGEAVNTSSVPRSQEAVLRGQQALQALVSRGANVSSGSVTNSQAPSSTPRSAAGMPMRRPGGQGQVDIGSMLSSVLNNPMFSNLMSNVAAQTGMESPADVRNIMEDLTQNRAVMDTLGSMVQNVDAPQRGQGGFDLASMMQQMMPVVSQVLGGASPRRAGTDVQPRQNDREVSDAAGARSSQMDLQEACQRIEQHDAPEDIFGAVLETAAQAYGDDESIEVMLEELASDPELADEYMKLLLEQVGERVESESEAKMQS
ncbi:ubiquitin-like domain-containing protein CIP73 isoform X1 [Triticum dicoccoides]|uniref:ubiquitin-like domain-containing protein CIP73 isoform X1 n=1 Tax=Triticum dicoccoides TaxID=85692 RepID=UPI0018913159|nr:ubiquitin-like domain-containing protein CIP73 isoform X1 [Triticum dicoccoides]